MATRMVTDCDKCGKENIAEGGAYRLEITVPGPQATLAGVDKEPDTETKRLDLDTKCLGQELQAFLNNLSPKEAAEWYERLKTKPTKAAAKKTAA